MVLSGSRKCPPVPPLPQPHLSVQHRLCARQSEEYRLQRLPAGVEATLRHVSLSRTTLALYTLVSCVLVLTAPHLCVSWPYLVSYLFGVLSMPWSCLGRVLWSCHGVPSSHGLPSTTLTTSHHMLVLLSPAQPPDSHTKCCKVMRWAVRYGCKVWL